MHIFHIKAGIIERICHFAVAIHAFFANDGCFNARCAVLKAGDAQIGSLSAKCGRHAPAKWLFLVVFEARFCQTVAGLFAVEQIRTLEPQVAQMVDEEHIFFAVFFNADGALCRWLADADKFHAILGE